MKIIDAKQAKASVLLALALSIVISSSLMFGFIKPEDVKDEMVDIGMKLEDGLEIVMTRSYQVCSDVKWSDIKATGMKLTETGINGFLQICERLALDFGNVKVYADFEWRLLWVYSESPDTMGATEVYYVQFT